MARIRNLASPNQVRRNEFRLRRRERSKDLQSASISEGTLTVIGEEALVVEGSQVVEGDLIINGTETVNGDVVINDGQVSVPGPNPIVIRQAPGGAVVELGPGLLWATGNDVSLGGSAGSEAFIVFNAATATIKLVTSSASITLNANGITMQGLPTIGRTTVTPNLPVGALWANPAGRVFRAN